MGNFLVCHLVSCYDVMYKYQMHVFICRWSEQLVVYPRTNKQNQKKKRKVEPATSQVVFFTHKAKAVCQSRSNF